MPHPLRLWKVVRPLRVLQSPSGRGFYAAQGAEWERLYAALPTPLPSGFSPSGLPSNVQIVGNLFLPVEVLGE
ncbi:unnamed protein product [Boreogadus saida]